MAAFVLVHGSGQNAQCWSRVAALLERRGHSVAAPDLPKHAADQSLEDHAATIAAAITRPSTVVVAHSFCGALLPLVPQVADCALLVFLAAVIPEPGKSVRAQFTEDPTMFDPAWIAAGPRWFDPAQTAGLAREFLFHDCDEEALAWGLRTLETIETQKLATQAAPFSAWPSVPVASVVATRDRTLSPDWIRRTTRRVLNTEALEVEAGHCPHVSRPQEIARLVERLAATVARG